MLARNPAIAGRVRQDLAVAKDYNALVGFAMSFSQEIGMYADVITSQVAKVPLATFVNWITVSASMFLESTADVTVRICEILNLLKSSSLEIFKKSKFL